MRLGEAQSCHGRVQWPTVKVDDLQILGVGLLEATQRDQGGGSLKPCRDALRRAGIRIGSREKLWQRGFQPRLF